ncbi:MAG: hypothetical protein V3T72_05960 [Thermoanaerobaculia bacterium]
MDSVSQTTTVLTLDLPGQIGDRLRRALRAQNRSPRDVTLEALEQWLDRFEKSAEARSEHFEAEPAARRVSAGGRSLLEV